MSLLSNSFASLNHFLPSIKTISSLSTILLLFHNCTESFIILYRLFRTIVHILLLYSIADHYSFLTFIVIFLYLSFVSDKVSFHRSPCQDLSFSDDNQIFLVHTRSFSLFYGSIFFFSQLITFLHTLHHFPTIIIHHSFDTLSFRRKFSLHHHNFPRPL